MYLAHIRSENGTIRGQTVQEHIENTARLCSEYASKVGFRSTGYLLGLLHDQGKWNGAFHAFIQKVIENPEVKSNLDHSTCGAVYISKVAEEIVQSNILESGDIDVLHLTEQIISICIFSHHGGLMDIVTADAKSPYIKRMNKEDDEWHKQYKESVYNFEQIYTREYITDLLIKANQEVKDFQNKYEMNYPTKHKGFVRGMLCKYLYSCLIDADRYDTASFAYGITPCRQENYQSVWEKYTDIINKKIASMPANTKINVLRQSISEHCAKSAELGTGIYTLNCPTGSGKNFGVTRFALEHAKRYHKDRIFYIIPYTSIIEQNAEAVRTILDLHTDNKEEEQILLELHSAKQEDEVELQEEKNENELLSEVGMKKQLASERLDAAITFMTMVRFLNTCFASGTKGIRSLHNFANSIIIFDEIQTLPANQIALFNATVNFLSEFCNATVILSTATQPVLNEIPEKVWPLYTKTEHELSGCTTEMRQQFKRTNISIEKYTDKGCELQETGQLIVEELEKNQNLLFVVNSKAGADLLSNKVRELLKNQEVLVYKLTTDLCAENRTALIREIKENLCAEKKLVVISTKLIEAGVDISFRVVYRSLCGLDSLIQCAGRCNRNGEFAEGELGQVYLINLVFDDVSRMHAVLCEQEAMRQLIGRYQRNPEIYSYDISSERAIHDYFCLYYRSQKDKMEYPITQLGKFTEYQLLNRNAQLESDYKSNHGEKSISNLVMFQSFYTASSYYRVIEDHGVAVVVPYKKGKDIIAALCADASYYEKISVLRKAQRYMVNLSQSKFKKLLEKEIIKYYPETDTWILKEGYYSDVYGVSEEPVNLDLLNF